MHPYQDTLSLRMGRFMWIAAITAGLFVTEAAVVTAAAMLIWLSGSYSGMW
jgi:hypothetical protein